MKTDVLLCDRCMRIAQFRFARAGAPPTLRCWRHAVFYGPVFRRALQVAAVVGTILFAINQLNVVLSGGGGPPLGLQICPQGLVRFFVLAVSALGVHRAG